MLVYTSDWVENFRRKYDNPAIAKPDLYHVVTDSRNQTARDEIEQWVARLPQSKQLNIIARLRSPDHFIQTYNELIVGNILTKLGYETRYEEPLPNGLTPDWYIISNGNIPSFIVEVFTARPSSEEQADNLQIDALRSRLQETPLDYGLAMDMHLRWNYDYSGLTPQISKAIVQQIKTWLQTDNPELGTERVVEGINFIVLLKNSGFSGIDLISPSKGGITNTSSLRNKVKDKVDKYKLIVTQLNLPFVVATRAEFRTGFGFDDFEDALLGQPAVFTSPTTRQVLRRGRSSNGLFNIESTLTAGLWLYDDNNGWKLNSLFNPSASNILPNITF